MTTATTKITITDESGSTVLQDERVTSNATPSMKERFENAVQVYHDVLAILKPNLTVTVIEPAVMYHHEKDLEARFFCEAYSKTDEPEDNLYHRLYFNPEIAPEIDTPRVKFRIGDFLENNGYEMNNENVDLFFILHEIGHIVFNELMFREGLLELTNHIADMSRGASLLKMSYEDMVTISDRGPHIPTMLNHEETWADNYAMKNYKLVYDELNQ